MNLGPSRRFGLKEANNAKKLHQRYDFNNSPKRVGGFVMHIIRVPHEAQLKRIVDKVDSNRSRLLVGSYGSRPKIHF